MFEHRCELSRCWYELKTPFTIDTVAIESGFSRLSGQLASGNFNFRHMDLALNVVGSGVIDCESDPSTNCFSNGFVEYSLDHIATGALIFDHLGEGRRFDFGIGHVNSAKALAAERLITQPIGETDLGLLRQAQFTKPELSGRPLSGVYRLRFYVKPSLSWEHVEDVQFIMRHRYWSRVDRRAGG